MFTAIGVDSAFLGAILANDMGGYQLAGELSASQEMVRYAGLVIAATLGCTITFTIPVGMGMLKSGDRLFFSRGMLIGTGHASRHDDRRRTALRTLFFCRSYFSRSRCSSSAFC